VCVCVCVFFVCVVSGKYVGMRGGGEGNRKGERVERAGSSILHLEKVIKKNEKND
jgi:hypothetical protein